MANLMDYLDWRGDLTVKQAPFNEVDNLILSELAYLDFRGIVPGDKPRRPITLQQAAQAFFDRLPDGKTVNLGVLVSDAIPEMLRRLAASPRFRDMTLFFLEDWTDEERDEQFAALAVDTGDGAVYLSFRGTDDTLAGWKEDFHMTFLPQVPAQRRAAEYVCRVGRRCPWKKLRLGGHSKGGNLAVWAAVNVPERIQGRIASVWSNDGPGFRDDILGSEAYGRVKPRITTIIPKSSVVGLLLQHGEDYVVVDSSEEGLWQHDGFSWKVRGAGFVRLEGVTRQGKRNDQMMRQWLQGMTFQQRQRFTEGLFAILTASGAKTLTDLKEERLKAVGGMIRAMKNMDKDTRDALTFAAGLLFRSNVQARVESWQEEAEEKREERVRRKKP